MEWNEILKDVMDYKSNSTTWYRGQSDVTFKLKSSLFRQDLAKIENYLVNERSRYYYYKNLGHLYHNSDDWELLYLMQHHGVKTRLLDWTESFATALFFASRSWKENDSITIWMLKPFELNRKTFGKASFYTTEDDSYFKKIKRETENKFFDNSVALHPVRSNPRIVAQQGVFTIQGNNKDPLNEEFNGGLIDDGILKEIQVEWKFNQDVKMFLDLAGANSFRIFPDLEGLATYINGITDNRF